MGENYWKLDRPTEKSDCVVLSIKKEILSLFKNVKEKGFFHLLSANFLVNFFAFGSQLLVAWIITPTELGQLKILQTFVTIAVLFASFGFNASTLKLCSENVSLERKRSLFRSAHKYTLFSAVAVYIGVYILASFDIVSSDYFINEYFSLFLIVLIPQAFNLLHFAYLQALKKIELLSKIQAAAKIISFSLIIVITYLGGVRGFIFAYVIGYLITSVFLFFTNSNEIIKCDIPKNEDLKLHWRYSKLAFLANVVSGVTRYLDIFIINFFVMDREAVGMYSFALNVILLLQIIGDTVQKISIPHFSEKSENLKKWKEAHNRYIRIFVLFALFLIAGLNLVIGPAVSFVFGGKYDASIIFIHILSIRWFFYTLVQFKGSALFGLGKLNYNLAGSFIYLILNVFIQYICVIKFGILGVAWGITISSFLYYLIFQVIFIMAEKSALLKK